MMPGYVTYVAFGLISLLLLLLPFVPAYLEWRRPTDFEALPISANYTSDIDHFARRMRADVAAKSGTGKSTGYEGFAFVTEPVEEMNWGKAKKRLIARTDIITRSSIRSGRQLYVEGNLVAGSECSFPAVYATGDIRLGGQSEVRDWMHADGALAVGQGSAVLRRVSAGSYIRLGADTWFERVHAPSVFFGAPGIDSETETALAPNPASYADLPGAVQQTPLLFIVRGDCALAADSAYKGSLVVTGFLSIGAGTVVDGDIKARGGIGVGCRATVHGAVICEKRIYFFSKARAVGPVISETDILVGADCVIGLPELQTTISAANIIVEDGVTVHGAIWAHDIGMVKSA